MIDLLNSFFQKLLGLMIIHAVINDTCTVMYIYKMSSHAINIIKILRCHILQSLNF